MDLVEFRRSNDQDMELAEQVTEYVSMLGTRSF